MMSLRVKKLKSLQVSFNYSDYKKCFKVLRSYSGYQATTPRPVMLDAAPCVATLHGCTILQNRDKPSTLNPNKP